MRDSIEENVRRKQESSPLSPLFNSTFAVELKSKYPTGDNPYEEKWEFLDRIFKKSFNKDDASDE